MLAIDPILHRLFFTLTLGLFFHQGECGPGPGMSWLSWDFVRHWKKPAPSGGSHSRNGSATGNSMVSHVSHGRRKRRHKVAAVPIHGDPQIIAARYIDKSKLRDVLNSKFDSDYRLQVSDYTSHPMSVATGL